MSYIYDVISVFVTCLYCLLLYPYLIVNVNFFSVSSWEGCGGYLHADRGIITSPSYPETYPPNLNCSWHVLVQTGLVIAVHFEQPFQVPNSDPSCNQGDYVMVSLICCFF